MIALCDLVCWDSLSFTTKSNENIFCFHCACFFRIVFVWTDPILVMIYIDIFGRIAHGRGNPHTITDSFDTTDPYLRSQSSSHSSVYPPLRCGALRFFQNIYNLFFSASLPCLILIIWVLYQLLPLKLRSYIWIYVLHPLPIIESAHSGHLDVMGIFCMMVALWTYKIQKWNWGGFFLILGGGIKILPFSLLPWFLNRGIIGGILILGIVIFPIWEMGALNGLQTYLTHWSFNGSLYPILHLVVPSFSRIILLLIWTIAIGYFFYQYQKQGDEKQHTIFRIALYIVGIWFLCTPTAHPWYGLWIFPLAILCGSRFWTLLCALLPLSYHALLTIDPLTKNWNPSIWPQIIEYTIPCLLLLFPKTSLLYFNPFPFFPLTISKTSSSQSQI